MSTMQQPRRTPLPGPAPGRRRRAAARKAGEIALRTSRRTDGRLVVEEIPLTLDILLHPREDDQVPQGNPHYRFLYLQALRLQRYLERRKGWGVFSDVLVTWADKSLRPVAPDVTVVEGIADPEAVGSSLDVAAEGCRVRTVIEVVSTASKDRRDKDEKHNKPVFARAGVEDYVLLYPREHRRPGDRPVRCLALDRGVYREQRPDAEGRFLLRSLGLRLSLGTSEQLVFEDAATGERVLTWDEEESLRLQAECRAAKEEAERQAAERRAADADRRSAQMLVAVLENRGLSLDDPARQRILDCRDAGELERWAGRAFTVASVDELWTE